MNLVFVYGTLLKGESRNEVFEDAHFEGEDLTVDFFDMWTNALYPLIKPGTSGRVAGEVYEVDDEVLRTLDRIEGHPYFYKREMRMLVSGKRAWIYIFQGPQINQAPVYPDDNGVLQWSSVDAQDLGGMQDAD